jgi:hypothetical protein
MQKPSVWNGISIAKNARFEHINETLTELFCKKQDFSFTWATAEEGVIKEKEEETAPEPAEVRARLVSLRWSSQVDAELASRSASPPCCLAVHVPPECLTTKVKTAISAAAAAAELPSPVQVGWTGLSPQNHRNTQKLGKEGFRVTPLTLCEVFLLGFVPFDRSIFHVPGINYMSLVSPR